VSRIFGSFSADVSSSELAAASSRLMHGGRDGRALMKGRGWSLGCNRLAVSRSWDTSEPYRLPSVPGVIAVLDGELYNRRELRTRLRVRGRDDGRDDTLLPALYAQYGTDFAQHLEGMFAAAVIDLRGEPKLILATDDQGMKTFYFHSSPDGQVHFASELPGLLAFSRVPVEYRSSALDEYLTTGTCLGGRTALEDIRTLPSATTATAAARTGLRVQRRLALATPAPGLADTDAEGVLQHGIRRVASTDVPVCSVITDTPGSDLITILAARQLKDAGSGPLHTFRVSYHSGRSGAVHPRVRGRSPGDDIAHHDLVIGPKDLTELVLRTVWHLGQPNANPAAVGIFALFRAVRETGFTVALNSENAHAHVATDRRADPAVPTTDSDAWIGRYVDALAPVPQFLRESLYTRDYKDHIRSCGATADGLDTRLRFSAGDRSEILSAFETGELLPARLHSIDHLSAACAVEARMPYLQPSVAALSRRPSGDPGWVDRLFHQTGRDRRPGALWGRRTPTSLASWSAQAMLVPGSPLWELAYDTLALGRLSSDGFLDTTAVRSLLAAQLKDPCPATATAVWALLVREIWHQELRALRPARALDAVPTEPVLAG